MILSEFRDRTRDSAFEDDAQMEDYESNFRNAANRALTEVHIFDIQRLKTLTIPGSGTYDMPSLASDFSNVKEAYLGEYKFNNYFMLTADTMVVREGVTEDLTFVYEKRVQEITIDSPDELVIDCDYDVESMLVLLASFYLWIDDEEEKAITYYNAYRTRHDDYIAKLAKQGETKATFQYTPVTGGWEYTL